MANGVAGGGDKAAGASRRTRSEGPVNRYSVPVTTTAENRRSRRDPELRPTAKRGKQVEYNESLFNTLFLLTFYVFRLQSGEMVASYPPPAPSSKWNAAENRFVSTRTFGHANLCILSVSVYDNDK